MEDFKNSFPLRNRKPRYTKVTESESDKIEVTTSATTSQEGQNMRGSSAILNKAPQSSDLRIVLVGRTGSGKSATGNTILGRDVFKVDPSLISVTKECQKKEGVVDGRKVAVVDTPGVFDTSLTPEEMKREIVRCVEMSVPGPHVFLVVVRLGVRYTEEEGNTVKWIQENFGEDAATYTIFLLSHVEVLDGEDVNFTLRNCKELHGQIQTCGGRYHCFNNKLKENHIQVTELLEKIDQMVKGNRGQYYTNEMYEEAQTKIREKEERKSEEERKIREDERKRVEERKEKEEKVKVFLSGGAGVGTGALISGVLALAIAGSVVVGPILIGVGGAAAFGAGVAFFRKTFQPKTGSKRDAKMPETRNQSQQSKHSVAVGSHVPLPRGNTAEDALKSRKDLQVSGMNRKINDKKEWETDRYYTNVMPEAAERRIREEEEMREEEERLRENEERIRLEKILLRKKFASGATVGAGGAAVIAGGVLFGVAEAVILGPVFIGVGAVAALGSVAWLAYRTIKDKKER